MNDSKNKIDALEAQLKELTESHNYLKAHYHAFAKALLAYLKENKEE
tara:strand:+ start:1890 stop:2030 length:141 start_codon:yes stop_codon:yes gene_type:complete